MRLTSVAVFAAGYIIGTRAGRERYAQIIEIVETASQRLEEFSASHSPDRRGPSHPGHPRRSAS